jgi:hypothetical protein
VNDIIKNDLELTANLREAEKALLAARDFVRNCNWPAAAQKASDSEHFVKLVGYRLNELIWRKP